MADSSTRMLTGRTIVKVSSEIMENWDYAVTVLTLDNGMKIYPSMDEDGNGPGELFVEHKIGKKIEHWIA